MWTDPASADPDDDGTGTGSGTSFDPADTLDDVTIPQGIVLNPGQQNLVTATLFNDNGDVSFDLPDVTFEWTIQSGGGISIVSGNTAQSVTIAGNSVGSAVLQVEVEQGKTELTTTGIFFRQTTVTVQAPGPTATPITPPTNPGPVPDEIENADGVIAPEGSLLISSDGVETGGSPENRNFNDRPILYILTGSVRDFFGVTVDVTNPNTLPALPAGINRGSSATTITFFDENGDELDSMRLERAAKVCLPVSSADLNAAGGGFTGLRILRYDSEVEQWVTLITTYNTITQQACAQTAQFSSFALGLAQLQATQTPGGGLPATGGWSPSMSLIALAGLVGVVLVGGGAVTLRRARQENREE
jgi:hypothetical protein